MKLKFKFTVDDGIVIDWLGIIKPTILHWFWNYLWPGKGNKGKGKGGKGKGKNDA